MVTHTRLQHYKHFYMRQCMTGCVGCRWHRYQQSKAPLGLCDLLWFGLLCAVCLFLYFWLYFWIVTGSNTNDLAWNIYLAVGRWHDAYVVYIIITCVLLVYITIVLVLAFFHLAFNYLIYIHVVHRFALFIIASFVIIFTVLMNRVWPLGLNLSVLSIKVYGPLIHVVLVILVTLLFWLVIGHSWRITTTGRCIVWISLWLVLLLCLYIVPLFTSYPCVIERGDLPAKPLVFGRYGAPLVFSENTMKSFETALMLGADGIETDISVSYDGQIFVHRDGSLPLTTNVADVFPHMKQQSAHWFNFTQLQQLDMSGTELQQIDTSDMVSPKATDAINKKETMMLLSDLLELIKNRGATVVLNVNTISEHHPHCDDFWQLLDDVITSSNIHHSQVWLRHELPTVVVINETFYAKSLFKIRQIKEDLFAYDTRNTSIRHAHSVNSGWHMSLCWCTGISAVSTSNVQYLVSLKFPPEIMTPHAYWVMWLCTDVSSVVGIAIFFFIHRSRRHRRQRIAEISTIDLSLSETNRYKRHKPRYRLRRHHSSRRAMREKLLYAVDGENDPGITGFATELEMSPNIWPSRPSSLEDSSSGVSTDNINRYNDRAESADSVFYGAAISDSHDHDVCDIMIVNQDKESSDNNIVQQLENSTYRKFSPGSSYLKHSNDVHTPCNTKVEVIDVNEEAAPNNAEHWAVWSDATDAEATNQLDMYNSTLPDEHVVADNHRHSGISLPDQHMLDVRSRYSGISMSDELMLDIKHRYNDLSTSERVLDITHRFSGISLPDEHMLDISYRHSGISALSALSNCTSQSVESS